MGRENNVAALPASFEEMLTPRERIDAGGIEGFVTQPALNFGRELDSQTRRLALASNDLVTVGLIDCYQFSRECLTKAIEGLNPQLIVVPFASIGDCIGNDLKPIDLIVYYPHSCDELEEAAANNVTLIRKALPDTPLLVLSDAEDAEQLAALRSTLSSGAHGFISTRTTGIAVTVAAIRFVKAGGTFAPLDLLLTAQQTQAVELPEATRQDTLTSRQTAVLALLQQGKANKIIAHELNMSESTVKVHVRNIMRRMGATNRTQAAYKAQRMHQKLT